VAYDAEQQRVLTTLLGSTFIEHLKDRLDYTAHTFARINDQLIRHPTRQGHAVRVSWQPDPNDPDAGAVVTALGQGYGQLSPERQDMVRSFLARQIDEARGDAADGATDWKDQLAQALDYRRWLRLSLEYRPGPGSGWSAFDTARHAAKSGGEKVVLLSQPLFAAAVVAYDAAAPGAPRWVWLDEAMTGVDATIKASFMGLTVDFELDIMLTAHDEWCNYATVPAVAVYDLARERHLPGVDVQPYLWCGGELALVEVDRLGAPRGADPRLAEGLFGGLDDGA
ncbi:MAG TPA: SbcC/MukB-like Walker B domain-containing protein, partial [Pseudonocardiaceae bacterium]|nr:SbcC/MukB-like Walker B domain-containing protein [Pseudonocardiaceae bacterium]